MAALLLRTAAGWRLGGVTASRSWELSAFLPLEAAVEAPGLQEDQMGRAVLQCKGGGVSPPGESMQEKRAEGKEEEWCR